MGPSSRSLAFSVWIRARTLDDDSARRSTSRARSLVVGAAVGLRRCGSRGPLRRLRSSRCLRWDAATSNRIRGSWTRSDCGRSGVSLFRRGGHLSALRPRASGLAWLAAGAARGAGGSARGRRSLPAGRGGFEGDRRSPVRASTVRLRALRWLSRAIDSSLAVSGELSGPGRRVRPALTARADDRACVGVGASLALRRFGWAARAACCAWLRTPSDA